MITHFNHPYTPLSKKRFGRKFVQSKGLKIVDFDFGLGVDFIHPCGGGREGEMCNKLSKRFKVLA